MNQQGSTIRNKVFLLNCVLLVALLAYLVYLNTEINRVKVNGEIYHQIVTGKDVLADVLPPPEYIIEAHLTAYQMLDAERHKLFEERGVLAQRMSDLSASYDNRHQYWLHTLPAGELKSLLVDQSYQPAVRYFRAIFDSYIPLLRASDVAAAERVMESVLHPLYLEHRQKIDRVVTVASQANIEREAEATRLIARSKMVLLSVWLAIMFGLFWGINRTVLNPITAGLSRISDLMARIGQGIYDNPIGAARNDELGQVLRSADQMQTRLRELVQSLEDNHRHLETVLDTVMDAVISIDSQGAILTFNRAAESIFGYAAKEIMGRNVSLLMPMPDSANHTDYIQNYLRTGQTHIIGMRRELTGLARDGHQFPIEITVAEMNLDGEVAFAGVIRDITERKHNDEALRLMITAANAASRAKSDFLANMSHEIRTPMNGIIGLSHLALRTPLNAQQQDYLKKIHYSAQSLLAIINDILDFSKIEAGRLTLEAIDFPLDQVFSSVVNLIGQSAQEKKLELVIERPATVPDMLVGDPLRLGQVLTNLASNAVKFTEQGHIIIGVEPEGRAAETSRWRFFVKDTGIGLSPEQISGLFQPFTQADSSTTRRYGGTGLGLIICKRLVEMMDGDIDVESEPGRGSTFSFVVALPRSSHTSPRINPPATMLRGLRALVADDNPIALAAITDMVRSFGMETTSADSGYAAVEAVQHARQEGRPYTLIMVDWEMPGMDGFQLIRKLRQADTEKRMVFIMITGHDQAAVLNELPDARPEGFLLKPITPSSLHDTIMVALNAAVPAPQASALQSPVSIGLADLKILLVEDNLINQQVEEELLHSAGAAVTIANNGREALAQLASKSFDLILMDIQMPEMDGYQTTRAIRSDSRLGNLPIIAMTAHAMAQDRERCLAAGMNDHVAKPIDPNELFAVISRWAKPVPYVSAPAYGESIRKLAAAVPGLDLKGALRRVAGNSTMLIRLLREFATNNAYVVNVIRHALASGDSASAESITHTLKGSAGTLGFTQVYRAAAALNEVLRQGQSGESGNSLLQEVDAALADALSQLAASGILDDNVPPR